MGAGVSHASRRACDLVGLRASSLSWTALGRVSDALLAWKRSTSRSASPCGSLCAGGFGGGRPVAIFNFFHRAPKLV